jgi:nucleotide-binding universal stress UspA family protein
MQTITKIMVAVDFSGYSLRSLQFAAGLARAVKARLLLVNVIDKSHIDDLYHVEKQYPAFSVHSYIEDLRSQRQDQFEELIDASDCEGLEVETVILTGHPYEAMLWFIKQRNPDLLVMATKGRSNLVATVIGSCAQKMFRHSPIPLISIR